MIDQSEIGQWHERTFDGCSARRVGRKLLEESAELHCALAEHGYGDIKAVGSEIADVYIVLSAIAHRCGINIQEEVKKKFDIVQKRY